MSVLPGNVKSSTQFVTSCKQTGHRHPRILRGNSFVACLCLSFCPVRALTFESLALETSFLVCRYIFKMSGSSSYVTVIGSKSRSQEQKTDYTSVTKYIYSPVVCLQLKGNLVYSYSRITGSSHLVQRNKENRERWAPAHPSTY